MTNGTNECTLKGLKCGERERGGLLLESCGTAIRMESEDSASGRKINKHHRASFACNYINKIDRSGQAHMIEDEIKGRLTVPSFSRSNGTVEQVGW